ncbi:SSI family serine proteinase inhibitor [Actinomadura fulvescens]
MISPEEAGGATRATTLLCSPDGGGHPSAGAACAQLRKAGDRISSIPRKPGPCTLEYAPVRASAHGSWAGAPRHFSRSYPNHCVALRETGGIVFDF